MNMILETLAEYFNSYKLNYSVNKLSCSLTELIKELQAAEVLFNKDKNKTAKANLVMNKDSGSKFEESAKASSPKKFLKPPLKLK